MNRSLRRVHRWGTGVLTLAGALLLGVVFRAPGPVPNGTIPAALARARGLDAAPSMPTRMAWIEGRAVEIGWVGPDRIQLRPAREWADTDLLVYWSPGEEVQDSTRVPSSAVLLGVAAGGQARTWTLPESAREGEGRLWLHSLALGWTRGGLAPPPRPASLRDRASSEER